MQFFEISDQRGVWIDVALIRNELSAVAKQETILPGQVHAGQQVLDVILGHRPWTIGLLACDGAVLRLLLDTQRELALGREMISQIALRNTAFGSDLAQRSFAIAFGVEERAS